MPAGVEVDEAEEDAEATTIDALAWLGRATLDVIGLAGEHTTPPIIGPAPPFPNSISIHPSPMSPLRCHFASVFRLSTSVWSIH